MVSKVWVADCISLDLRMTVRFREVTQEDLPIFFDHDLDAEATRMAAFFSGDTKSYGALGQNHE